MKLLPGYNPSKNMSPYKLYYHHHVFLFRGFSQAEQQLISSLVYHRKFCALKMTKNKVMSTNLITFGIHYNSREKCKAEL